MGPERPEVQRRPCTFDLQRCQELCRTYSLLVSFDVRYIQEVIKDALAAFLSSCGDNSSRSDIEKSNAAEKADLKRSPTASEEKLADADHCIQRLEKSKSTWHY